MRVTNSKTTNIHLQHCDGQFNAESRQQRMARRAEEEQQAKAKAKCTSSSADTTSRRSRDDQEAKLKAKRSSNSSAKPGTEAVAPDPSTPRNRKDRVKGHNLASAGSPSSAKPPRETFKYTIKPWRLRLHCLSVRSYRIAIAAIMLPYWPIGRRQILIRF
jgi:hypothetical protein